MRSLFLTSFILLMSCASAAYAQCGPNGIHVCQPGKVPDSGSFGGDYGSCHAAASQGQKCWREYYSQWQNPDGSVYEVPYCAPVNEAASCYCTQGQGEVTLSGTCTFGAS